MNYMNESQLFPKFNPDSTDLPVTGHDGAMLPDWQASELTAPGTTVFEEFSEMLPYAATGAWSAGSTLHYTKIGGDGGMDPDGDQD